MKYFIKTAESKLERDYPNLSDILAGSVIGGTAATGIKFLKNNTVSPKTTLAGMAVGAALTGAYKLMQKSPLNTAKAEENFRLNSGKLFDQVERTTYNRLNSTPGVNLTRIPSSMRAGMQGRTNSPTLAYQALYNKNPETYLTGRTFSPKKMWNGFDVDVNIKDKWLTELNNLPVEIRSTEEGKSAERPAFVVFRLPEELDPKAKDMVSNLRNLGLTARQDIGSSNRPRIVVTKAITVHGEGWEDWWEELPTKIKTAYNKLLN